tara:strand:+ start:1052 stop:1318 length:267 start_codon:yes stop_codon:yes gene_type:complete
MFYIIALILFLCIFSYTLKEGYLNYQDLSENISEKNCPQMHADNYKKILMNPQMVQPYGYTKNDLFHMTRFMKTDVPLPTDPDLFYHI